MKSFLSKLPIFLLFLLLNMGCHRPVERTTKNSEKAEKTTTKASVAILGMLHFVSKNNTVSQEETDQLAFRLAKDLGHEKLYLAYAPVNFDFESAMEFAIQNDQQQLVDSIIRNARELAQNYDRILAEKSLTAALQYLNTEEAIAKNHFGYLLATQIGNEENSIGTEIVGEWYKANLKIYLKIQKLAISEDDRIMVIYGQGHLRILGQLIEDSRDMELIPIEQFLE
ncbi:DUF5694 domain-containing protein [Christiangramia portivictoriae]|uniref:DUF5694 domain-containing protein n=1 Tax=Christiangramia portivictoriae TaxID=326069 RepID=UPI00047EA6CE|nr:DUF5694 domain-containing protein [Christiangramia portivictoriae]